MLNLIFYEVDAKTPVAIADVPEPRWLLGPGLLLGYAAILLTRRCSTSRTPRLQ